MNTRLRLLLLALLALAACERADVDIRRGTTGSTTVTVTLHEEDLQAAIGSILAEENPLLRDPQVDLQDGRIIVSGEHDRRDGQGRVSGSVTLTLGVEGGELRARITAVDIEGVTLSDAQIAELNERLSEAILQRAGRDNRILTMISIAVSEETIQFVFVVEGRP